jgi:hypothetical protein
MKTEEYSSKRQIPIITTVLGILLVVWFISFYVGSSKYNIADSPQNYGSIIQGMSALLGIVLAAAIFRIQSLENRLQSLENATLDYVYKIAKHAYPEWDKRFEENIKNGGTVKAYLSRRLPQTSSTYKIFGSLFGENQNLSEEDLKKDSNDQQEGLNHILSKHANLKNSINDIKRQVIGVSLVLITPIAISFIMLMSTNTLPQESNFFMISFVVYLSIVGIVLLLSVVLQSMFQKIDS